MPTQTLEGFPLTDQQKRSWRLRETSLAAHSWAEIFIEGNLNEQHLRRALDLLVQRHEILRTGYYSNPGNEPVQVIQEQAQVWGTENGSGLRAVLRERTPTGKCLHLACPALSIDRTSIGLLLSELVNLYGATGEGTAGQSEPFQYVDYAQWQADLRDGDAPLESQRYWAQLRGSVPDVTLPLERNSGAAGNFSPVEVLLSPKTYTWARLQEYSATMGISAESVLLTVWGTLLAQMCEAPTLPISVESDGRGFDELRGALGLYNRQLPLAFSATGNETLRTTAVRLENLIRTTRRHADGFRWAKGNNEGELPLQFAFRKTSITFRAGECTFRLQQVQCTPEPFKLRLEVETGEGEGTAMLAYDLGRISSQQAELTGERFLTLLSDALSQPDKPLNELSWVGSREKGLVQGWAYSTPPRRVVPILRAFAEFARKTPEAEAVSCDDQTLSYRELNERANQLAHRLLAERIEAGQPVGLCMERSVDLVVGIVGILKAGGAYVPLDPGYPRERLDYMVKDSGTRMIVAQPGTMGLVGDSNLRTICISPENEALRSGSKHDPKTFISPDQLAYIIYTSGSTGMPKGVMIPHSNLAISTAARVEYYQVPVGNYLLLSSYSFDSSIAGIFWALTTGGKLTLPVEGAHQDPKEIISVIQAAGVTHLLALPSFYQAILERTRNGELSSLTHVIVAGESCPPQLVKRHHAILPKCPLFNEYGPTEGTVWATVHRCSTENLEDRVPIGRPVPGLGIYILNEQRDVTGVGVTGEIYIAGPTLAKGYLNRDDLTDSKFIVSPFLEEPRLYRTGDRGRFLENGEIDFLGRIDHQVKIRGYRVELGEIEKLINEQPGVREVAVVARGASDSDQRLIAYVVASTSEENLPARIRKTLAERVPGFMVPSQFVLLEKLPLAPNGKLDRQALPAPTRIRRDLTAGQAPSGPEEELLARIWTELLKLDQVGKKDNFFEMGGHSLLALQMLARIRDNFQVDLPLRTVFDRPVLEDLASWIRSQRGAASPGRSQIQRVSRQTVRRDQLDRWEEPIASQAGNGEGNELQGAPKAN